MKKLVTMMLTLAMVFSLAACGAAGGTQEAADPAASWPMGGPV